MDIYAPRYRANCVDHLINRLYLDLLLSNMTITNVLRKVRLNVQTSCTVEKRQRLIAGELGSCGTCFILWIDGSNISNRDDIWSNAHFALTWCGFSDLEQSRTICTMWCDLVSNGPRKYFCIVINTNGSIHARFGSSKFFRVLQGSSI